MKLEGMHHITMITGDAPQTVAFYADTLGLRLVKTTVNFDAPEAYHLYFGDEQGSPGSILTWFEFAGAPKGQAGPGMIHTIELGVRDAAALDFWQQRLEARGTEVRRRDDSLAFTDHDGLGLALVIADPGNPPLVAEHPEVPAEHAIVGVEGARAYLGRGKHADRQLLTEVLGFEEVGDPLVGEVEYVVRGDERSFRWGYDIPRERGRQGAGTVHHIAWHARDADHVAWQSRVGQAGFAVTPVIDRDYFDAIYFRQPHGILFEIATTSPGFAVDEDPAHLGESLRLPTQHEHLRPQLEQLLTPLSNPRVAQREAGVRA
jgi:glyoxalase family protein